MRQPETTYRLSIERKLPRNLHREKMANPFRSGTADCWYSGTRADLWVEYKWIPHVPRSASITPALSGKQSHWLNSRMAEGRNVAVILGSPDGGLIYTEGSWREPVDSATFVDLMLDRGEIAAWIEGVTCGGRSISWRPPR